MQLTDFLFMACSAFFLTEPISQDHQLGGGTTHPQLARSSQFNHYLIKYLTSLPIAKSYKGIFLVEASASQMTMAVLS